MIHQDELLTGYARHLLGEDDAIVVRVRVDPGTSPGFPVPGDLIELQSPRRRCGIKYVIADLVRASWRGNATGLEGAVVRGLVASMRAVDIQPQE